MEEKIKFIFSDIFENRDESFANGRTVRNIFEMILQNQASRISELLRNGGEVPPEVLNEIIIEDLAL